MADLNTFRENLHSLVSKFEQDKNHYLQKGYPEAQVRIDFLNPFFDVLGCVFRSNSAIYSGAIRPLIPIDFGHPQTMK